MLQIGREFTDVICRPNTLCGEQIASWMCCGQNYGVYNAFYPLIITQFMVESTWKRGADTSEGNSPEVCDE